MTTNSQQRLCLRGRRPSQAAPLGRSAAASALLVGLLLFVSLSLHHRTDKTDRQDLCRDPPPVVLPSWALHLLPKTSPVAPSSLAAHRSSSALCCPTSSPSPALPGGSDRPLPGCQCHRANGKAPQPPPTSAPSALPTRSVFFLLVVPTDPAVTGLPDLPGFPLPLVPCAQGCSTLPPAKAQSPAFQQGRAFVPLDDASVVRHTLSSINKLAELVVSGGKQHQVLTTGSQGLRVRQVAGRVMHTHILAKW